jgi:hypothetical protein
LIMCIMNKKCVKVRCGKKWLNVAKLKWVNQKQMTKWGKNWCVGHFWGLTWFSSAAQKWLNRVTLRHCNLMNTWPNNKAMQTVERG